MPNDRKIRRQVKRALKRGDVTVSDPKNVTPKDDGPNWINVDQLNLKKSKNTFSPQDAFEKMNNPTTNQSTEKVDLEDDLYVDFEEMDEDEDDTK